MDAVRQINDIRNHRNIRELNRIYVVKKRINPFTTLNDSEFKKRYRVSKDTARYIIDLIRDDLKCQKEKNTNISPELQVLIALRFFAKGLSQVDNGDLHGVSQKTVSNCIKKVAMQLASHVPNFIKFADDLDQTKRNFFSIAGFPNVIGSIDCTHIKIKNPDGQQPLIFCNRKGFYSLNVQVVCDYKNKICNIVARWRGSAHDARIWDECTLKEKLELGEIRGILLGDAGYPCRPYLLTPLANPTTRSELRYNSSHIRTRNTIERLFGQWKALFRSLQIGMCLSLDTIKASVAAMAVVHNIRKTMDIEAADSDLEESDEENDSEEELEDNAHVLQNRGTAFRANFIRRHFA